MTVLLQVSDPHFGTEQAPVMHALQVLAQQQRPELVVLSGDITQRATAAEFAAARAFMHSLGAPLLAIPGNHDIPLFNLWARLRRPYARHAAAFGAELEPVHESPELLVLGVNTTRWWRHRHGEVSAPQVERVAAALARARAAQLRVVVVHQPVAVPRPRERLHLLRGAEAALQRWAAAGADLVLGGHIHLPCVLPLPGLARPLWAVQAGTAVSARVRPGAPNSVNLLRWGADAPAGCCRVEQWDWSGGAGNFACVAVSNVVPARG